MDEQFTTLQENIAELRRDLGKIREEIIRLSAVLGTHADHEIRLRELEAYSNRARGGLAIAAVAGGIVSGVLTTLVRYLL